MEAGPVAQRIRARGYEPRCRGFESLLAHVQPASEFFYCRSFTRMIGYLGHYFVSRNFIAIERAIGRLKISSGRT